VLGVGTGGPGGGPDPEGRAQGEPAEACAERDAWAVLASVGGLGPVGLAALLRRYGTGRETLADAVRPGGARRLAGTEGGSRTGGTSVRFPVTEATAVAIAEAAGAADRILGRIAEAGLTVVTVEEAAYPRRLGAIEMPPHVLFVRGSLEALHGRHPVAVVGTRRPTLAGRSVAARIAAGLARAGATVVSGLAVGIDGAAHAATIEAGGRTVAVIGSGHAVLFPRAHARLADRIVATGGAVVSELPPDVGPTKGTFPRRNRVISGLTDATVVVEAPARSGALITASWALEQGRECFVVPGSIDAPASAGCLALLHEYPDAVRIVAGIPQLLDDLALIDHRMVPTGAPEAAAAALVEIGGVAGRIGRELVDGRSTVDELVAVTGLTVATVLGALTVLEGRGLALSSYGRYRPAGWLAARPPRQVTARRAG
jgi:DNA processing protein